MGRGGVLGGVRGGVGGVVVSERSGVIAVGGRSTLTRPASAAATAARTTAAAATARTCNIRNDDGCYY